MSDKFMDMYRIPSVRLNNRDYRKNASTFVTVCTGYQEPFFGTIRNNKMELSEIGKIAKKCWHEIPNHFPFVKLGAFVVMPNHIHGIITIDKKNRDDNVETLHATSLHDTEISSKHPRNQQMADISPKPGSLSTIVRSYKSAVTKKARQINPDFGWQSRFYDHVIRNDGSIFVIRKYIKNNIKNWNDDDFKNQ